MNGRGLGVRLSGVCALAGVVSGWTGTGCPRLERRGPPETLRTVGQVRRLPAQLAAPVPVRLRGTITYLASTQQQAFLQDATGGVRVENVSLESNLAPGDTVELAGTAVSGGSSPVVMPEQVRVLAPERSPPAAELTQGADIDAGELQYRLPAWCGQPLSIRAAGWL